MPKRKRPHPKPGPGGGLCTCKDCAAWDCAHPNEVAELVVKLAGEERKTHDLPFEEKVKEQLNIMKKELNSRKLKRRRKGGRLKRKTRKKRRKRKKKTRKRRGGGWGKSIYRPVGGWQNLPGGLPRGTIRLICKEGLGNPSAGKFIFCPKNIEGKFKLVTWPKRYRLVSKKLYFKKEGYELPSLPEEWINKIKKWDGHEDGGGSAVAPKASGGTGNNVIPPQKGGKRTRKKRKGRNFRR